MGEGGMNGSGSWGPEGGEGAICVSGKDVLVDQAEYITSQQADIIVVGLSRCTCEGFLVGNFS